MQQNLITLFNSFKTTTYYTQSSFALDLEWLQTKLDKDDFKKLENQILTIL